MPIIELQDGRKIEVQGNPSPDEIDSLLSDIAGQGQPAAAAKPAIEPQGVLGAIQNVPGATSRAAIMANPNLAFAGPFAGVAGLSGAAGPEAQQAAGQGALQPDEVPTFQKSYINAAQNSFGGPSQSVAVNFAKGLIPSAWGLAADVITNPLDTLLQMIPGSKGGRQGLKTVADALGTTADKIKPVLKYETVLQKTQRAKTGLDELRQTIGKAKELAVQEVKNVPAEINWNTNSKKVFEALNNPIYKIERNPNESFVKTVGNLDKMKTAVGELINNPKIWEEAPKTEQRQIKQFYGSLNESIISAAKKAGKDIRPAINAYHNFMENYRLVNKTLVDTAGNATANKMKAAFHMGAEPNVKRAWKEVAQASPKVKSVMGSMNRKVLLGRLLKLGIGEELIRPNSTTRKILFPSGS